MNSKNLATLQHCFDHDTCQLDRTPIKGNTKQKQCCNLEPIYKGSRLLYAGDDALRLHERLHHLGNLLATLDNRVALLEYLVCEGGSMSACGRGPARKSAGLTHDIRLVQLAKQLALKVVARTEHKVEHDGCRRQRIRPACGESGMKQTNLWEPCQSRFAWTAKSTM